MTTRDRTDSEVIAELETELARLDTAEDDYERLRVSRDADRDAVRRLFVVASRPFHPDLYQQSSEGAQDLAQEVFMRLSEAERRLRRRALKPKKKRRGQGPSIAQPPWLAPKPAAVAPAVGLPRRSGDVTAQSANLGRPASSLPAAKSGTSGQPPAPTTSTGSSPAPGARSSPQMPTRSSPVSQGVGLTEPPAVLTRRVGDRPRAQAESAPASPAPTPSDSPTGGKPAEDLIARFVGGDALSSAPPPPAPSLTYEDMVFGAKVAFGDALSAMIDGRYVDALRVLDRLMIETPENIELQTARELAQGHRLWAEGKSDQALVHFHRACVTDGSCTDAIEAIRALEPDAVSAEERLLDRALGART